MDKLKPCPFCGSNASIKHNDQQYYWIDCDECGASTNMMVSCMDDCMPLLINKWNHRLNEYLD